MPVHRMTICVPDVLRQRMGRFADVCNWSEIAARAFAAHVEQLEKGADPGVLPSLFEVVARLEVVEGRLVRRRR